jgi:hypothetical protein
MHPHVPLSVMRSRVEACRSSSPLALPEQRLQELIGHLQLRPLRLSQQFLNYGPQLWTARFFLLDTQQLVRLDLQGLHDFEELSQREIALPALDCPQILIVQPRPLFQSLLGQLLPEWERLDAMPQEDLGFSFPHPFLPSLMCRGSLGEEGKPISLLL